MSASLVCYIVVGPADLFADPDVRKQAQGRAKEVIEECKRFYELEDPSDEDYARLTAFSIVDEDVEDIMDYDVESILENLEELWDGELHDAVCRELPGDPTKCIVATGDMTWGDEPELSGFQTLKKTEQLGLWSILGIE